MYFSALWLQLNDTSKEKHQIFFKEHSVRKQETAYPRGRTLFVLNVPPYATSKSLKAAFARSCGNVAIINVMPATGVNKTGFQTAYVVFTKDIALDKALALPRDYTMVLNSEDSTIVLGLKSKD